MGGMPARQLTRAVAAVLMISFLLGACASSSAGGGGYSYMRNTSERTAFRLPQGWTTYDEATVLGQSGAPQGDVADPIKWLVGIDADPAPSVNHVLNGDDVSTDYPEGIAMVQELSFAERDSMSFSSLRNYIFPVDQLIQDDNNAVVVSYDDQALKDGMRGVHMVVSFRESVLAAARQAAADPSSPPVGSDALQRSLLGGGGTAVLTPGFVEFDQYTLLDPSTNKLYLMILVCTSECYQRNRATIEDTVNSWTVSE
jgi:hypothetical protein